MGRWPRWVLPVTDLWLIGIGTGNPAHVTLEGMAALREAQAVLIPRKGAGKEDLAHLRHDILRAAQSMARIIEFDMPRRDETLPYGQRVTRWHDEIARRWQAALNGASSGGPVALLVWGDPGLYDSTLRIAARLSPAPDIRVIPGITALQALTAAHAIPFNTVNGAVTVTTGRRLRERGWPSDAATVAVMLDSGGAFASLPQEDTYIWWGAYLGMDKQCLIKGWLNEVSDEIIERRAELRESYGWIMDCYLMAREPLL